MNCKGSRDGVSVVMMFIGACMCADFKQSWPFWWVPECVTKSAVKLSNTPPLGYMCIPPAYVLHHITPQQQPIH